MPTGMFSSPLTFGSAICLPNALCLTERRELGHGQVPAIADVVAAQQCYED